MLPLTILAISYHRASIQKRLLFKALKRTSKIHSRTDQTFMGFWTGFNRQLAEDHCVFNHQRAVTTTAAPRFELATSCTDNI